MLNVLTIIIILLTLGQAAAGLEAHWEKESVVRDSKAPFSCSEGELWSCCTQESHSGQ